MPKRPYFGQAALAITTVLVIAACSSDTPCGGRQGAIRRWRAVSRHRLQIELRLHHGDTEAARRLTENSKDYVGVLFTLCRSP